MAYNEELVIHIRDSLGHLPHVEEKKMFRGITFMVNGKMCISVASDEIMCRIDPDLHDALVEKGNCRTMVMKGKEYKGYVLVSEKDLQSKEQLDKWIQLALAFNAKAKASKKK